MSRSRIVIPDRQLRVRGLVVAVLTSRSGKTRTFETENIVTIAGNEFYSMRSVIEQPPTNRFTDGATPAFDGIMELYNGASPAPLNTDIRSTLVGAVANSQKAMDATYPLRNDSDPDNTGAGPTVTTYRVSYTTAEANAAGIADVIITNPTPAAGEPLLMHAAFGAAFTKTASDTLKVFVNHTFLGV